MAFAETLNNWMQSLKQWPRRVRDYFAEVWSEVRKVSWPTDKEVYGTTVVVILTVFIFGFYLFFVDFILGYGIDQLYRFFGTTS